MNLNRLLKNTYNSAYKNENIEKLYFESLLFFTEAGFMLL